MEVYKQYNKIADLYKTEQDLYYKTNKEADTLESVYYSHIITPVKNAKLLDIGCGFGRDLDHYKKLGYDVYGIDSSSAMVQLSKQAHPDLKLKLFTQSFDDTKFKDNYFDVITCRYVIQYSNDLDITFKELHRILKPSGHLVILATHPLTDYFMKKSRDYFKKEIMELPLFRGDIKIKRYAHSFSEYFSDFLINNFSIDFFSEKSPTTAKAHNIIMNEKIPDFFILKGIKK